MTQEEKAKAYDEAIDKAKKYYKDCKQRGNLWFVEDMEDMFPVLTESDDERIRKEMIEKFTCWLKDNFRDDAGLCCIISDFDTTKEMYNNLKQAMRDE